MSDTASLFIMGNININVLDNDTDLDGTIISVEIISLPNFGNVTVNTDNSISYTHTGESSGSDSFTYRIQDNEGAFSDPATVDITIEQAPITAEAKAAVWISLKWK